MNGLHDRVEVGHFGYSPLAELPLVAEAFRIESGFMVSVECDSTFNVRLNPLRNFSRQRRRARNFR